MLSKPIYIIIMAYVIVNSAKEHSIRDLFGVLQDVSDGFYAEIATAFALHHLSHIKGESSSA